jgi:hypothetical protein
VGTHPVVRRARVSWQRVLNTIVGRVLRLSDPVQAFSSVWWTWEWMPRELSGRDHDHAGGVISFMVDHLPPQENGSTK